MEQEKKPMYAIPCTRCRVIIETYTKPLDRQNAFLCNSCHMMWQEKEKKLIGHAYEDEMRKAFVNFLNELPYLRNIL